MFILKESLQRKIGTLCLVAFLLISFCGLLHFGMVQNPNGTMSDCPFAGFSSMCSTNPMHHMSALQNILMPFPLDKLLALFLLFLSFIFFSFQKNKKQSNLPELDISLRFLGGKPFFVFSSLQEAFSNGILNPKTY